MKILQTLATEYLEDTPYREYTQKLLYHLVSALSIRQAYGKDQEFILITDTQGKSIIEDLGIFPYTTITTDLDNWPYARPFRKVGYKLYGFELYPDDDIIHFDNDVFIKNTLPEFTDVLVQGHEGNFLEMLWDDSDYVYEGWVYPPAAMSGSEHKLTNNYNPGVLGFKANSSIREQFVNDYNQYLNTNTLNLLQLKEDNPAQFNSISGEEHQWINTALEESYLYHLCQDNGVNVVEALNPEVVPTPLKYVREERKQGEFIVRLTERHYDYWQELGYIHPFNRKRKQKSFMVDLLGNIETDPVATFIPNMTEEITTFLKKRYGTSENPSNEEIAMCLKKICLQ